MCGNGICDELVCQGEGCACPETYGTCPEDCSPGQGQWLDSYECKNNWRYRKYLHGNGTQSWKNYEYCPYGCSNSACVEYNYSNETIGCTPEGGTGSPNEINCCEGLEGYTNYEIDSNGSCVQVVEHGKHVVCIDCGNGFCGSGENYCNCPEDCPSHVNQTINQTQNQWLNEYKCQQQWSQRQYQYSNGTEQWLNYTYCGYGCSNGECLNQPGNNTGGEWTNNYQCSGNWSRRKWVFGNESYSWKNYEFCEYGCNESNGVCRNESAISQCTDTDNGNNTHATGTTCGWSVWPDEGWTCKTDYCIQRNNDSTYNLNQSLRDPYSAGYVYSCLSNCAVMEYYCGDGDTIVSDVISCGSVGCINGTCAGYSTN